MRINRGKQWTAWLCGAALCAGLGLAAPATALAQSGRSRPPFMEPGSLLQELRKEEYQKELNFTDEQREELRAVQLDIRNVFRAGSDEERKQKMKELEDRALELLTAEQLTQWDKKRTELLAAAKGDEKKAAPVAPVAPAVTATPTPSPKRSPVTGNAAPANGKPMISFAAPGNGADNNAGQLSFNFQFAPWTDVLELFAKAADLTLDLEDVPPGTFSYRDSRSYNPTEVLDVLNGYLLPRSYLLVRRDRFLVCLDIRKGIPPNLAPEITAEELPLRGKNELLSLVIPLKGLQADTVISEVRELLGPQGKASALKNTNSIVVTDIGSHVRRIFALLTSDSIDNRDTVFKSIPLKHISATEAERMVRRLFGLNNTANVGGAPAQAVPGQPPQQGFGWGGGGFGGGRRRGGFGGGRDGGGGDRDGEQQQDQQQQFQPGQQPVIVATPQPTSGSQFANKIQVAADVRTNNLMVTASAALLQIVEDAVKAMDTNLNADGQEIHRVDVPITLKTYTVAGGDISTISQTINQIVPGVVVGQDARIGKIYVQATAEEHEDVNKLIQELSSEGSSSVAVVYLQRMDSVTLANTLNNLYSREGVRAPTVEADPVGRRLIIRGTPDQIVQVKTILTQLGEGEGAARDRDRGNVRSLTLHGRDPEEILPLLKEAWSASRTNPIRIRVPSRPKPIRDRLVPGANLRDKPARDPLSDLAPQRPALFRPATFETESESEADADTEAEAETATESESEAIAEAETETEADTEAEASEVVEPKPKKKPAAALPELANIVTPAVVEPIDDTSPLAIEVVGDQLIITSKNAKVLDRFEELYEGISAAMPSRAKWNVFYLRSADATEAAQMIERLFPQSNVTTTTASSSSGLLGSVAGGINTLGRGLMNMSGLNQTLSGSQNLRLVTDVRSNALFVTGPHDQVAEVEQILEVLDASELPQSLRDRVPRTIAVEHADVEEVAAVVETVFKDAMTPENQMGGGGRGFNPLMMMMGGGGGGGQPAGGRRQPTIQLTVGIDRRTNHLIVSCNDSLYQQIETLVRGIDDRAKQSRQTVRVVKLEQADPTLVQQTLGSLMTKVTVGATRRSRKPNAGNGAPTNAAPPTPGGAPATSGAAPPAGGDAVRDAFFQRMMMNQLNPGGGGNGGGGGGGGFGGGGGGRRGRGNANPQQ